MADRFTNPVPQYFSNTGLIVPGGKLFFFDSGTSNPKDTFNNEALTVENTNPVIIDGAGRTPSCFFAGSAKVRLTDSNDVLIWERDPVTSGAATGAFEEWDLVETYSQNQIVTYQGLFYKSKTDLNQGNQPDIALVEWEQILFDRVWNSTTTYQMNERVSYLGDEYKSLQNDNTGAVPSLNPFIWTTGGVSSVVAGANISVTGSSSNPVVNIPSSINGQTVNGVNLSTSAGAGNFLNGSGNYVATGGEVGTFTPTLTSNTGSGLNIVTDGTYTKIGDFVYFNIRLFIGDIDTMVGNMQVGNLPFTLAAGDNDISVFASFGSALNIDSGTYITGHNSISGGTTFFIEHWDIATGVSNLVASQFSSAGNLQMTGFYKT